LIRINGGLMQNQSNKIKHHRRWNIAKVSPPLSWSPYFSYSLFLSSFFKFFSDKRSSLDTLPSTVYCIGDIL
jgi:hypothetical protein